MQEKLDKLLNKRVTVLYYPSERVYEGNLNKSGDNYVLNYNGDIVFTLYSDKIDVIKGSLICIHN